MPNTYIPACCSPPSRQWLLPHAQPLLRMASCSIDAQQWQAEDFVRCQITPARGAAKRQSEYLAGRLCAREALHALCGIREVPAVGEDGAPQWPAGVVGSITHGGNRALAVVANAQQFSGLGLDIERWLPEARAQRLHAEILTHAERQRAQLQDCSLAWLSTLSFSLKESLFKALYPLVQKRFYFQDAELLSWDANGHARLRLLIDLSEQWPAGSLFDGQFAAGQEHLLSLVSITAAPQP